MAHVKAESMTSSFCVILLRLVGFADGQWVPIMGQADCSSILRGLKVVAPPQRIDEETTAEAY